MSQGSFCCIDSAVWASTDASINLYNFTQGFVLADANFDVWLANIRGNTYGSKHLNHSSSEKEFWDFR